MNKKANELGLKHTHFVTPHGLDEEEHYTTAYELAKITDYALNIDKFAEIVRTKHYTVTINGNSKTLNNTNELLGNLNGVYGVKTGFTNGANRCLVTAIKRDNLDIICVVLGADTKKFRTQDSVKLIEYTFNNYQLVDLNSIIEKEFVDWKKQNLEATKIIKGKEQYANPIINTEGISYYPINNQNIDDIKVEIEVEDTLYAPVCESQIIGKLTLKVENKEIIKIDIVSDKEVLKKSYYDYFIELLTNFTKHLENFII